MWEAIKKFKGIPLDPYDQALNDMMHRTARDEIIPFDEWQNLMDDLDSEWENSQDVGVILREYGLTLPVLVKQANEARAAFLDTLHRYGLPLDDRLKLCQLLYERVKANPSDELLRLYCDIVCDGGFLLDIERGEEEGAVCWLEAKEDADALYDHLFEQAQVHSRTREIDVVHALCGEILEASALPRSQQPKTARETALFLAAINDALMEAVDCAAIEYLTAIGRIFLEW